MSDTSPPLVMISSTCLDLPRHREEVRSACEELRCLPRMMEHLPASDDGALGASLALVDEADIYIGVFAFRYGYVPKGETKSITHREYERARERGLPLLIFLMDLNHRVVPADIETGEGAERLRVFKKELQTGHSLVVKSFRSPKDLHAKVLLSLGELLRNPPPAPLPPPSKTPPAEPPPAVAEETLRAAHQQLFRIEAQCQSDGGRHRLIVNLGFTRVWIRDPRGRRLPVVCGCAMARSEVRFQHGRALTDPSSPVLPPETRVVVEFGTGPRPVVRLESCPPRPYLEGRAQLVFEVKQDTLLSAGALPHSPLAGVISVEPEWFTAERPPGVVPQPAITEEVEALLNAWLDGLQRQSPAMQTFTL